MFLSFRKLLITPLLFVVVLVSAGCQHSNRKFRVGVAQCSDDEWRTQMNKEMRQEATFYGNISLEIKSANDNSEVQIKQIREFVESGVDLLVVSPNEMIPVTAVIEEVYNAGIPVVVIDRKIDSDKYTASVGANNYKVGEMAGRHISSIIGTSGSIIELSGSTGSSAALERHYGFLSTLSERQTSRIIASADAGWESVPAEKIADSLFRVYGSDVDVVFAHNDRMALGAYNAAQKLGLDKIKFVSIDALAGAGRGIDMVAKGCLDASFLYPTGGHDVVGIVHNILMGNPFNRDTELESALISMSNVETVQLQNRQLNNLDDRIKRLNVRIVNHRANEALQRLLIAIISVVSVLAIIGIFFVLRMLRVQGRMNKLLRSQNSEITLQRNNLEIQRDRLVELSKQLEEATHSKLMFFTNVSHDLRTPLTLIADPVKYLQSSDNLTGEQRSLLTVASKNIDILLRMIEQILDFRTYENGKAQLKLSKIDLHREVIEWASIFKVALKSKNRRLRFNVAAGGDYTMNVDREKVERIFFNLLQNALKNAKGEKPITVDLFEDNSGEVKQIGLSIKNGCDTLTEDNVKNIFTRFYKVSSTTDGAGIGLAITKAYVDLHGGTIDVKYSNNVFEIVALIPVEQSEKERIATPLLEEENDVETADATQVLSAKYAPAADIVLEGDALLEDKLPEMLDDFTHPSEVLALEEEASVKPLVLVVDDNQYIRDYIATLLKADYQVIVAVNGVEGLELATQYLPDLMICDVMMPEMGGIELCECIKKKMVTCHIPVLMLTACTLDEQRAAGYEHGADSYISKPFSFTVLKMRVKNLIENRKLLMKNNSTTNMPMRENFTQGELKFIERFNALIEENLSNSELTVEELGREMCFSRVQLYRKVKVITGESPNKILRNARLRRGEMLLRTTEMSVAEVAYEVGFTSPSYFSKTFKEFYGLAPRETNG